MAEQGIEISLVFVLFSVHCPCFFFQKVSQAVKKCQKCLHCVSIKQHENNHTSYLSHWPEVMAFKKAALSFSLFNIGVHILLYMFYVYTVLFIM